VRPDVRVSVIQTFVTGFPARHLAAFPKEYPKGDAQANLVRLSGPTPIIVRGVWLLVLPELAAMPPSARFSNGSLRSQSATQRCCSALTVPDRAT
jgi:hypothetical protein